MKNNLHPAAIAAAVAALVVLVGFIFVRFGSSDIKETPIADTMKVEVNHNKVNSVTGEPLLPDQIAAQERQNEMVRRLQGTAADPRKTGNVPNPEPNAH